MKQQQKWLTRSLVAMMAFALSGAPEAIAYPQAAQQTQPATAGSQDQSQQPASNTAPLNDAGQQAAPATTTGPDAQVPAQAGENQPANGQPATVQDQPGSAQQTQQPSGTTVDPSQGPLTPVPSQQLPEAPSASQPPPATQQQGTTNQQQQQTQREPLGAAAAEGVRTAGGGASRPAGSAIAPAKQRQVRSLLIKLGAVAAAGAAIGTVYLLSRGTSSTPPNSAR